MNGQAIRLRKEARALFWPWCAIMASGILPVFFPRSESLADINLLGFFFGLPLLATLSLGNEFHHRTFALWLAQPATRLQLWGEKMSVMCAAVLSAGAVTGISMYLVVIPVVGITYSKAAAVSYVIITVASATFWTLSARSTVGGFILIGCIFWVTHLLAGEVNGQGLRAEPLPAAKMGAIALLSVAFAGLMLWLGVRRLKRFQVTGGAGGEDLLLAGPSVMPEALAGWFHCRPTGVMLNLVRKELRQLRPLWLIEGLVLAIVAFLAVFRLFPVPPESDPRTVVEAAVLGTLLALCCAMAGLAGILPVGEERRSGTHAWQMTLPYPAGRQWLVKVVVAMVAGPACSLVLPLLVMMAGGALYGSALLYVYVPGIRAEAVVLPILTLVFFWCSCAVRGTVRAAVVSIPVTIAIWLSSSLGRWLGAALARTTGTLGDLIVSSFHLGPQAFSGVTEWARDGVLFLFVPTLLVALVQSRRLFRTQPEDGVRWLVRCLLPLVAVTILWGLAVSAGLTSSRWQPFDETRRALDRLQPRTAIELTGQDLARGSSLSPLTERWLRGASLAVVPDLSHSSGYVATIRLSSGRECKLNVADYGGMAASCGE